MRPIILVLKVIVLVILFSDHIVITLSELREENILTGICSGRNEDIEYGIVSQTGFEVLIDYNLLCTLIKPNFVSKYKIRRDVIMSLKRINSETDYDCMGNHQDDIDYRMQWYIDTRMDFPYSNDKYADMIRSRILKCVDMNQFIITDNIRCVNIRLSTDDMVRNTIDYYAGFIMGISRSKYLRVGNCQRLSPINANSKYSGRRSSYLKTLNFHHPIDNYEGRSLQDPNDIVKVASLTVMQTNSIDDSVTESSKLATLISVLGLIGTTSSLVTGSMNIANIFSEKQKNHNAEVESLLLKIAQDDLETRRMFLTQMANMIKEQRSINTWLGIISEQICQIIDVLEEIKEEIEEINDKLDYLQGKIELIELTHSGNDHISNPNISDQVFQPDKIHNPATTCPLFDIYDSLHDDFRELGCDSFKDLKSLYQDVSFYIFYLKLKAGKMTREEYREYRFNSVNRISYSGHSGNKEALYLGGWHMAFTKRYKTITESMDNWAKDVTIDDINDCYRNTSILFDLLESSIKEDYKVSRITMFQNELFMFDNAKESSVYNAIVKYLDMDDLCMTF